MGGRPASPVYRSPTAARHRASPTGANPPGPPAAEVQEARSRWHQSCFKMFKVFNHFSDREGLQNGWSEVPLITSRMNRLSPLNAPAHRAVASTHTGAIEEVIRRRFLRR